MFFYCLLLSASLVALNRSHVKDPASVFARSSSSTMNYVHLKHTLRVYFSFLDF